MIWKKGIRSRLIWACGLIVSIVGLFAISNCLCNRYQISPYGGYLFCGLVLVLEALGIFLLIRRAKGIEKRMPQERFSLEEAIEERGSQSAGRALELVLFLVILALGSLIRILSIAAVQRMEDYSDNVYVIRALVSDDVGSVNFIHGITHFHVRFLHLVFFLVGNKPQAAYVAMTVVQLVGLVFFYLAVRKIGKITVAIFGLLMMVISPLAVRQLLLLSPEVIFFFFFAWCMLLLTAAIQSKRLAWAKMLVAGLFAGGLLYLDIGGIALIPLIFGRMGLLERKKEGEDVLLRGGSLCTVTGALGMVCGFLGFLLSDAVLSGNGISRTAEVWEAWRSVYRHGIPSIEEGTFFYTGYYNLGCHAVLLVLMCLGIYSIWIQRRDYGETIWTGMLMVFLLLAGLGIASEDCSVKGMIYLCSTVSAGTSLDMVIKMRKRQEIDTDKENIEKLEKKKKHLRKKDREDRDEIGSAMDASGMPMPGVSGKGTPGEVIRMTDADGQVREVKLLDNPLELPKKKEHKALDYDIDVPEDDDFDI